MPKLQNRSRLESMFGSGWQSGLPQDAPRSEPLKITDAEARDLLRAANALGTTPEVLNQMLSSPGKRESIPQEYRQQLIRAGIINPAPGYSATPASVPMRDLQVAQRASQLRVTGREPTPYTNQSLTQAGYTPQQRNTSTNQNSPEINRVVHAINQKLEARYKGLEAGYKVQAQFQPDPHGGHYVIQLGRSYKARDFDVEEAKQTGEVLKLGQEIFQPRGEPFKLGAIQGTPTVGVMGSSASYVLKHQDVRQSTHKDLAERLAEVVFDYNEGYLNQGAEKSMIKSLGLQGKDWGTIGSNVQYMSPAGKGAELSRYAGRPEQGAEYFDPGLRGVRSKGVTLPFSSVHMQIPGYIKDPQGRLMLGSEGLGKDTTKRPRLHIRDYTPAGPRRGQPHVEAQANFMWSQQKERESAIPMRGVFFTEQMLPEGQAGVNPRSLKYVTENFADNPEKFRIPLLAGVSEDEIAKSLGLLDDSGQRSQRVVRSGQKIKGYPGHSGHDVAENFESATLTGFDVVLGQDAEGNYKQYIQLQGHRDTDIGGSAAIKFGGMKALTTSVSPSQWGFSEDAMFNTPSSSRQFMANVLNYMPRQELEEYWQRAHGSAAPELIDNPDNFKAAAKVYGAYLKDHYQEHTITKKVTEHEMERLRDKTGDRFVSQRKAGLTTAGEQLYDVAVRTGAYHLPFGAKVVRESSSQENVRMSHEEGDFYRAMGMPQVWEKVRGEGGYFRAPHEAIAEAMALNSGKGIKANRPVHNIDELAGDTEFKGKWQTLLEEKRKELTPADFTESMRMMSAKDQRYQTNLLESMITEHAMREMFGEDALFKVKGQHLAGPALLSRFGFIDKETNREFRGLQGETQGVIADALGGKPTKALHDTVLKQAQILEGGGRSEWLSARTKHGIEGTYASLDELGTNEAATSYRALSDMFGLKELGLDWRTAEGKKAIDDLSRQGQLLETGMRNPTSNPRQTAGLVRNFITENLLKERGLDLSLGTSRTVYNNPAWVWSQGGDNDSDRLRLFAMTRFARDADPQKLLELSPVEQILKAAKENPAGEMQDYEKKIGSSQRRKFFNFGTRRNAYDPGMVMAKTTEQARLLTEQTGATYNFFRRILPALSEQTHPAQQGLIGLASAKYFQPLIDQKAMDTDSPEGKLISFLSSYQGFRGSYRLPGGENAKKPFGSEDKAFDHMIETLGQLYDPKDSKRSDPKIAQMVASMIAAPSQKGSGAKLTKLLMEGQFNPANVNAAMGGSLASSEDSPMARLLRGMSHSNALNDLNAFKKHIESSKQGQTKLNVNQVTGYANTIDNRRNQLPKELQEEWAKIAGEHTGKVFKDIIEPKLGPEKVLSLLPPEKIAGFLEKALPHFNVMKKSRGDFEALKDIMGPVASERSALHQSAGEIINSPRQAALGTVPMLAEGERNISRPTHAIIGEAGPEDVVPHDKTVDVGGMRMYDPASLGNAGDPGSLMRQRGMVRHQTGGPPARFGFEDDPHGLDVPAGFKDYLAGIGGGAGGPPPPPTTEAQPEGEKPRKDEWQRIGFTKPLSEQYVMDLELMATEGKKFATQIQELNARGGEVSDAFGEMQKVIHAGNRVNTSYQAQLSRVQRTIEKYDVDQEMVEIFGQFRGGSMSREAKGAAGKRLTELKARKEQLAEVGMTQRITSTEYGRAKRAEDALLAMGGSYTNLPSGAVMANMVPESGMISASAEIAARSQQNRPMWQQQSKLVSQGLRTGKIDRKLMDIMGWQGAIHEGQRGAFAGGRGEMLNEAVDLASLSGQRQALYEQAVPLKQKYEQALATGNLPEAQRKFDELQPLMTKMGDLKDEIGILTPQIKEHVDVLKTQTSSIKEEIQERKAIYSALSGRHDDLQRQAGGLHGPERLSKIADIADVRGEMDRVSGEIKGRATRLGQLQREQREMTDLMHEPQGRAIGGLGKRPMTRPQMAIQELTQGYDPQRMFYQFQNMQQLQYMAFAPMLGMRDQYLQQQQALGQAGYALGGGQMPQSVIQHQVAQANMSRAQTAVGKGVNNSWAMQGFNALTNNISDNQGIGETLGSVGFDALSAFTLLMGGKMALGPLAKAGGKLLGGVGGKGGAGLIGQRLAQTGFGGAAPAAGGLSGLGIGLSGLAGVGVGIGVNEALAGNQWDIGGMAGGALSGLLKASGPVGWGIDYLRQKTGTQNQLGFESMSKYGQVMAGGGAGQPAQPTDDGIPVYIKRIEADVAKQLGVDKAPFDSEVTAQFARAFAESGGVTQANLEDVNSRQFKDLSRMITESFKSGVSPEEFLKIYQAAPGAAGYAPGTEQGYKFQQYTSQGSLFQRQQRLEAVQTGANVAGFMGMNPDQQLEYSQQIAQMRQGGASEFQVGRFQSQRQMGNAYDWSAAAYASGNPDLALMDQADPWRPKYQKEQWAIEDRRRQEDVTRELGGATLGAGGFEWSGGRQEQELGWQQQKMDMEEKFWDFRRKSQDEDFQIQQKLFDFNIKQMRYGMDREEKQSQMQVKYHEQQYQIQKKIFDLQTKWQRQDFDKQETRMDTQRGWQLQDFATNRSTFEMQAGWQQDDLERALRYSSGRERIDIRRQMERAGIMADVKRNEMDRDEERATVKYGWEQDDLATARARFDELRPLQEEQMLLGQKYWEEQKTFEEEDRATRRAMIEEQIGLMTEQNDLNKAQYEEQRQLAQEQHDLERGIAEQKLVWNQQDLELARQRSKEDEIMIGWQRQLTEAQQKYSAYTQQGYEWLRKSVPELEKMARAAQELANTYSQSGGSSQPLPAGIPSKPPNSSMAMFAEGGPVNRTGPAIVHEDEYVVPQHGALVMRSSQNQGDSSSATLEQILALLKEGGGKILIDKDQLQADGFIHIENYGHAYR